MKMVLKDIDKVFILNDKINHIVIENQTLFTSVLKDIHNQIELKEGQSVLSKDNNPISFSKNVEMISELIPFNINSTSTLNKLYKVLGTEIKENVNLSKINNNLFYLINDLIIDSNLPLRYDEEINLNYFFKAISLSLEIDDEKIGSLLLEYFNLLRELNQEKVYIIINLRNYISDDEIDDLYNKILYNEYRIIILSGGDHTESKYEEKLIIDKDLCQL